MNRLEFPNETHRIEIEKLRDEWSKIETPTSPGRLFSGVDFDDFLDIVINDISKTDEGVVSAHLFLLIQDTTNRILGAIQIRHHINHPNLIEEGGHIGYGIRPSERQKGYATEMLKLALDEARKMGLKRTLITCDDNNIGSWKTIEANGGIFERFANTSDGSKKRRYWVDLSDREDPETSSGGQILHLPIHNS